MEFPDGSTSTGTRPQNGHCWHYCCYLGIGVPGIIVSFYQSTALNGRQIQVKSLPTVTTSWSVAVDVLQGKAKDIPRVTGLLTYQKLPP